MKVTNKSFKLKFIGCSPSTPLIKEQVIDCIEHYAYVIVDYAQFELSRIIQVGRFEWTVKIKEINANRHSMTIYDHTGKKALKGFLHFLIK